MVRGKVTALDFSMDFTKTSRCDRCRNLLFLYSKHRGIPLAFSINTKKQNGWRCVKCVTSKPVNRHPENKGKFFRTYDQIDDFLVRYVCSIVRNEPYDQMDEYFVNKLKKVIGGII
tara:strand:- start:234 stop:581 length:348 start_codon:yes stop_codon:yes gene_type:complete